MQNATPQKAEAFWRFLAQTLVSHFLHTEGPRSVASKTTQLALKLIDSQTRNLEHLAPSLWHEIESLQMQSFTAFERLDRTGTRTRQTLRAARLRVQGDETTRSI